MYNTTANCMQLGLIKQQLQLCRIIYSYDSMTTIFDFSKGTVIIAIPYKVVSGKAYPKEAFGGE